MRAAMARWNGMMTARYARPHALCQRTMVVTVAKPPATATTMRKSRCLSSKPITTSVGDWRITGKPLAGAGLRPTARPSRLRRRTSVRIHRGPCPNAMRVAAVASTPRGACTLYASAN